MAQELHRCNSQELHWRVLFLNNSVNVLFFVVFRFFQKSPKPTKSSKKQFWGSEKTTQTVAGGNPQRIWGVSGNEAENEGSGSTPLTHQFSRQVVQKSVLMSVSGESEKFLNKRTFT